MKQRGGKRIGIFLHALHYGGIEKFIETHNEVLEPRHNECHIVVNREGDTDRRAHFESLGYRVHCVPMKSPKSVSASACAGYRDLFKAIKFDVAYCNLPTNALPLYHAGKAGVPRKVLHSHSNYLLAIEGKSAPVRAIYSRAMEINASRADALLACSEEAAAVFGRNASRTRIVNNSVDFTKFRFSPEARERVRREMGVDGGAPVFCHVGRMEGDIKNHRFLLDVFKDYYAQDALSRLILVGDGRVRPEFEQYARDLGIADACLFVGTTNRVADYLNASDMFLFPSKSEGLGISLIEAQATGMPCVASDRIPPRAKYMDNVAFAPIDEGPAPWLEAIGTLLPKGRAVIDENVVARSGYSIEVSSSILRDALGLSEV